MTSSTPRTNRLSRRDFLGRAAAVAGGVGALAACSNSSVIPSATPPSTTTPIGGSAPPSTVPTPAPMLAGQLVPGAVGDRVLVIVDLQGGNDGLSTLMPIDSGRLRDLRPNLTLDSETVLTVDDEMGFHPALSALHTRGVTTVEGVGPIKGDLSHFAMADRWQRGDVGGSGLRTGFLGRVADAIASGSDADGRIVGVSLTGSAPTLVSDGAAQTLALSSVEELGLLAQTDWEDARLLRSGLESFIGGDAWSNQVTASHRRLIELADLVRAEEPDWDSPLFEEGGDLGQQLWGAAQLIKADVGLSIVYAATGDYDTHDGHLWRQEDNLRQLDAAVDGFLDLMAQQGAADRVLVATVSEFGRRVPENANGLDHGAASTMLVAGPVGSRQVGDRPSIDDLDDDGNLKVSIGFDRYLASLAEEWLGVEAASVLPDSPEPLGLIA